MQKPLIVYLIFALMLATAALYFVIAIFGENYEPGSHEAKAAVETSQENVEGTPQHESTKTSHVTTGIPEEHHSSNESSVVASTLVQDKQVQREATESHNGIGENNVGTTFGSVNEITKKNIELPLFLAAGSGYAIVGFLIVVVADKGSSRILYIISATGSLILLGTYAISHTIGLPLVGLEHVGVFDLFVAALQVVIVGLSAYVILSLSRHKITRSAERNV